MAGICCASPTARSATSRGGRVGSADSRLLPRILATNIDRHRAVPGPTCCRGDQAIEREFQRIPPAREKRPRSANFRNSPEITGRRFRSAVPTATGCRGGRMNLSAIDWGLRILRLRKTWGTAPQGRRTPRRKRYLAPPPRLPHESAFLRFTHASPEAVVSC